MKLGVAIVVCAACSVGRTEGDAHLPPAPPPPAGCRDVAPGELAAAIAAAHDGDALCLEAGEYRGGLVVDKAIAIWGPRAAVLRGAPGTIVTLAARGASLAGLTIDGTGGRFEDLDSAVHVIADDVAVTGVEIVHAVYGILVEQAARARIEGNLVHGDATTAMGVRGDTIRLWQADDAIIADNLVEDGRDLIVWYSNRAHVTGNRIARGRYGTHFMYSTDDVVADNRYLGVVVGVFVMYSHRLTLERNVVADAGGAAGMAIGLKDSGDVHLLSNLLARDALGVFLDDSPSTVGETLEIRGNALRQCDVAFALHTTPRATTIADNDLADDREAVRAEAGVDAGGATWRGNYYDDYTGYDLDGDGAGDLPYQAHEASEAMIAQHPDLAFFRGSPVMAMVDAASSLMPLFAPRVLLTDPAPRMSPHDPEEILDAR